MFFRLNKYGELNNYDIFKVIAFVLMIIDHLGFFFFSSNLLFRTIGRLSFPIYAILHGITKKNNTEYKPNYLLLFLGILLNIMFYLLLGFNTSLNILVSFFVFDFIFSKFSKLSPQSYVCLFILIVANYIFYGTLNSFLEYGLFVLLFMFVGKIFCKVGTNLLENVFCFSVFATYFLTQTNSFDLCVNHSIVFAIMSVLLFISMYDFKFREYHNLDSNKLLLFISRYSMELYFLHYALFMILFKINIIK